MGLRVRVLLYTSVWGRTGKLQNLKIPALDNPEHVFYNWSLHIPIWVYNLVMARKPTTSDPFNAVAEPRRRKVLEALGANELSVNEIVALLGWPQPMVSKHLGVLKKVGLVSEKRVGRQRTPGGLLGFSLGKRAAGLAYRVFGHVHETPRRAL